MKVNKNQTVCLHVDAQKGFTPLCPNELPVNGGEQIIDAILETTKKAKYKYMSKDAHPKNAVWVANEDKLQFEKVENGGRNVDVHWNRHCVVGTEGFELLNNLPHPSEYDFLVYKGVERDMHPYSPIYQDLEKKISTGIIEKAKIDGIKTFILVGLALDYCLGEGAFDLKKAGFEVIVNLDATRPIGNQDEFVEKLKNSGIKVVNNANEIEN